MPLTYAASRGGASSMPAFLRSRAELHRAKKNPPAPVTNEFGRGAEKAFKQADVALSNMSKMSELLQKAAQQQMQYSQEVSKDIRNIALEELGYSREDRARAEEQMARADEQYAQYDQEFQSRKAQYDSTWKPVEERTAELAMEAGKFDEGVVGRAGADAAQASAAADAQARHQMAQMGISPESGRYGDWSKDLATQSAGLSATLKNQARTQERNRARTEGLSAASGALGLGHNIYRGDVSDLGYKRDRANTLYGLSEAARSSSAAGRSRGAGLIGQSANIRQQGMSGLGAAANIYGQVGGTAAGLAGTYAPLAIEQSKMDATPTMEETAQQRMDIMDQANARTQKTRKSYPWAYVFGGTA